MLTSLNFSYFFFPLGKDNNNNDDDENNNNDNASFIELLIKFIELTLIKDEVSSINNACY